MRRAVIFSAFLLLLINVLFQLPREGVSMSTEATRWQRYASNPLFGGANAAAAGEPSVFEDGGVLKMWYSKGWSTSQINLATSSDGLTWTDYGSNPVFNTNNPQHALVVKISTTYYLYYVDITTNDLYVTTSSDGISWGASTLIAANNAFAWEIAWGNPYVWLEGAVWYGLFEFRQPAGANWQMSLFTSADGLVWTLNTEPIISLRPGAVGGDVGGAFMTYGAQKHDGLYHLWYHGNTTTSALPTDIYHAVSPDLVNWTPTNGGNPVLVHSGVAPEEDQVADPSIVEFNGTTFLYFSGVNNSTNTSKIEVVTFAGPLINLINGQPLPTATYHIGLSGRIPLP